MNCLCGAEISPRPEPRAPGDVYFCFYCLRTTVFTADGTLRRPTDEEWGPILAQPVPATIRAALETFRIRCSDCGVDEQSDFAKVDHALDKHPKMVAEQRA